MNYRSTRSAEGEYTSAQVIKQGLASDGGLFVPTEIPKLDEVAINALTTMSYRQRAAYVLGLFLTDYTEDELLKMTKIAYSGSNFGPEAAPLSRLGNNYVLELWHGPTSAFKDMALQIMPMLLSASLEKTGESRDALILVATSGDTGKAALEGYKDVPRVSIKVFYPENGVSDIQKRQMQTQEGENVSVCAIKGNFDDAQNGVKAIFADSDIAEKLNEKKIFLSSANSINFGRLAPQIVYYISAYCDLYKNHHIHYGEKVNVCVPTGNFGNILAAYIAKRMGIPFDKLICASNSNNVLTDFFATGVYDRNRPFHTTISPSMDILISSNLERLLWFAAGDAETKELMRQLSESGRYSVSSKVKKALDADFSAFWCSEGETAEEIKRIFNNYNYLCDTHTAVAMNAARKYKEKTGDETKIIIASTASPYKFAPAVCKALGIEYTGDEFAAISSLADYTSVPVPKNLSDLLGKPVRFTGSIEKCDMAEEVLKGINI